MLFYLIFVIIVSGGILLKNFGGLDEIWNYNVARCIQAGLLPYKDISIITTPLFYIICSVFLKFFGNEFIVMRILSCFVFGGIFFVVYKILNKLKISHGIFIILSMCIVFYYINLNIFIFEYNWASLLIQLILLFLELGNTEKPLDCNLKKDFLLGILAGLTILFKQTTGLIFCFVFIGYKILNVRNLEEFKKFVKIALIRLLGVSLPVLIFIIYLLINGIFNDFLEYCIYGITTFSNKVSYLELLKSKEKIIMLLAIIMPAQLILMSGIFIVSFWKKSIREKEWFQKMIPLLAYSIRKLFYSFSNF